jgi:hypothetical protein
MPQYIIKIQDRYFIWSTVVDAPVTYGMNRDELEQFVQAEQGARGLEALPERLERVEQKGTSSRIDASLAKLLVGNRAGDGETRLTEAEIYAKYASPPET